MAHDNMPLLERAGYMPMQHWGSALYLDGVHALSMVKYAGYRITACAATDDQCAFVLSQPRKILPDETQETLRTSQFPSQHVKV